ncbi:MAG TPA: hypothetical protein PK990_09980 [Salinivirgaceae bacterium]|nr:hypothetical protein [Salinivirgaceae bacterium]
MKSFYINLNESAEKGTRYRKFLMYSSAALVLMLLLTFVILYNSKVDTLWYYILPGLYVLIFIYLAFAGYQSHLYISADERALEYQLGFHRRAPLAIFWQSISKVKIGPTYISFYKQSGRKKTLQLGWLSYQKLVEVKSKIEALCKNLNIPIEYGEIRHDF